jgi:non-specific serine/threonine protein kinase
LVDTLIGAGGMGEVYKARDPRLQRTVAIKILRSEFASPDRLQRFEREARAASALNHPNILSIYDIGREDQTAWFAMEWVDGRPLRDLIRTGPLPLRRVLEVCHQIAEGLGKAHSAGIVHRDLKPENVMVGADGHVKIVDFGLAKLAAEGTSPETVTRVGVTLPGEVMGTVGYMSPEQASGQPVDYRTDQFALGVLIYELATSRRPFARATPAQTLAATIQDAPVPIEQLNAAVPAQLAAIVARCLEKSPDDRYEATRDLARELKHLLERSVHGPAAPARVSGWRWPIVAAASVLIALAAAAAMWWAGWRGPAAQAEPERPLIAVRALQNLSPDPAQGYFAAGMTEEIRGQLSQVSALRMLSASAVAAYGDADVVRMVRELGVDHIVEGTVRVAGNRVRIAATLTDGATQQIVWRDQYDRELSDILGVQSDVALRIAQELQANLSPDERTRLERRPTDNLEAYQLYLQSRSLSEGDRNLNLRGMDLLQRALELDPAFTKARAALAYRMYFMSLYDDPGWSDKGVAEAEEALRRDPTVADVHFVLGSLYTAKGLDAQARLSFLRGIELNPSHGGSMNNLSIHEAVFGRYDESLHWARRAFALSSKRGGAYYHPAVPLLGLRDDALTRRWLTDAERLSPDSSRTQIMLAILEVFEGNNQAARQRIATLYQRLPNDEEVKIARADVAFATGSDDLAPALEALITRSPTMSYAVPESVRMRYAYVVTRRGDTSRAAALRDEAERVARERIAQGATSPVLYVEVAAAAALRGDHQAAFDWLSRAHDAGYRDHGWLERDPILAPLAGARFEEILTRMRNDVAAQRERARARGLLDLDALTANRSSADR